MFAIYSKTCLKVKRPLSKRSHIGFQDQLSLNAGQKYCRMLQREHSAILSTLVKLCSKGSILQYFRPSLSYAPRGAFCNTFDPHWLPFFIKIFILSIFEWPFTVCYMYLGTYKQTRRIDNRSCDRHFKS